MILMAKAIYEGVNGVARKVKNAYEGVGNVARKVKAGYIGVGGVARQFFSGEYRTLQEAYQSGAWSSCVLEWEYEKLDDSDRFDDYTYVSAYLPLSGNILYRNSDLATTSHTDIRTNRLVYHKNIYFFCPTQADATLFADFLSKTFTNISGYDTNKNISAFSKNTINSVYCYTSVCSSAGVQIPYYEGASSITYWKAYETAGYSDKWVIRVTANSSFFLAWNSDGYARDLNQITFS